MYHILYSTLSSPVYPHSVQISLCCFCLCPLLLCLIRILRRTLPPPASGLYVWCSPAAHDLSSADAASSSPLASPYAAHGRHQRKCCALIPAGRGSSAAPVVTQRGSLYRETMVTHTQKKIFIHKNAGTVSVACLKLSTQVDHLIQSLLLQASPPAPLPRATASLSFHLLRSKMNRLMHNEDIVNGLTFFTGLF